MSPRSAGGRMLAAISIAMTLTVFFLPAIAYGADSTVAAPTGEPRKTIAVGTFESPELLAGGATGPGLEAMLDDALVRDGRFVVLERSAMPQIQNEQTLGKSGSVTAETTPQSSQMIGASVMVFATVTKFIPNAAGNSLTVGGFGNMFNGVGSSAGVANTTAKVEINLRLVDTSTGQIIYSGAASGTASSRGVTATIYTKSGMQIGDQAFLNTPLGKAAQQAIDDAVRKISLGMARVPWSALVVENDNGTIYIDAGADQNMRSGMTLHVYRKTKVLTDPQTNVVLQTLFDPVGVIQIQSVSDKVSTCTATDGSAPARGDVLKLE